MGSEVLAPLRSVVQRADICSSPLQYLRGKKQYSTRKYHKQDKYLQQEKKKTISFFKRIEFITVTYILCYIKSATAKYGILPLQIQVNVGGGKVSAF